MINIDARTFSINYFRHAVDINWCLSQNERERQQVGRKRVADKLWNTEDVNNAARFLLTTNKLDQADRSQVARFCQEVEKTCLSMVRNRENHTH